ncbi:hypothetical protein Glove_740g8 [Diversispora epigaea]|uniref:Uncharacterized protein n=1 Tax=Diversispora epigaea TaxID=1348612 RepID=A0A397G600_9GLOM|nr:hypothetical protein Glove_740g8 [Diversispora epigaea]
MCRDLRKLNIGFRYKKFPDGGDRQKHFVYEKTTRSLNVEDQEDQMYKRQQLNFEEPLIEWEFNTPKPSWMDRIVQEHQSLISSTFNCDKKTQYELSLNPIWWRIIDLSDPTITTLMSEDELSELNTKFSSLLENWTTLEPEAERCLQSLEKCRLFTNHNLFILKFINACIDSQLDNDQLRTIGEIVRPKGTYGAILELQELLENKKEQNASKLDNLFEDENDFNKEDNGDHKEILSLTLEDHINPDVTFIFDLIRYTVSRNCWAEAIDAPSNAEGYHLNWMFMVWRHDLDRELCWVSRNCWAEAIDAPSNAEGYHLNWMFMVWRHDLDRELCWGREFSLCERTGSKAEDTSKILSNTLKAIFAEGGGTLSKPVLQAGTKLLMPRFLSSHFFIRAILIIYIGGGFYASVNLADIYIPTKYQELEFIIKISRTMFQIKKLLSVTISRFKQMKNRAEREKFTYGKVAIPARQEEYKSFQKPKIDSLKQQISELEVEKVELETKNVELLKQVMEENAKRKAENAELKARIEELEKNKIDTTNLKVENDKLNARVVKLEQSSNNITHELENSVFHEASSNISSNICVPPSESKSLEDIETDNFLDAQSKKEVSDMMRKRNKEKKLQTQGSHNTSLPMLTPLIPSEISISNEDNSPEVFEALDLKIEKKLLNQNQSKNQNESHKKKGTENIVQVIADGIQDALVHSSTNNIHSDLNHVTEISTTGHPTNAEYYAMKANQEETLCWINYGSEFIIQYNDLIKNSNGKIGEKKAKGIIYDKILEHITIIREKRSKEMGLQLPEISRKTLCKSKGL